MGSRIEKIVKNLDALPSLPIIANKLMQAVDDKHTAAKDLAEVISKDPALTAKVLKLVNSSFFGFSNKITMVSRAVVVLGFNTIKNLALGISVFKTAKSIEGHDIGLNMEKFWEHSLGVSAGARLIARLTRYKLPEEAFVAGLLHDIGKIIFNQYIPEEFSKAIEMSEREGIPLEKAEMKFIGADHEVAGDYLAEKWKLPYTIRKVISQHHNPPTDDKYFDPEVLKLICIVSLSNTLCKMKNIGFSGNKYIGKTDEAVLNWLDIEEGLVERFFLEIDNEFARAKEFLGLSTELEADHTVKVQMDERSKQVLVIKKGDKKVSLVTIFIKSFGFDCHEIIYKSPEDLTLSGIKPEIIFTDDLDEKFVEEIKIYFKKNEIIEKIVNLTVPFDSSVILKELGLNIQPPAPKIKPPSVKIQPEKRVLVVDSIDEERNKIVKCLEEKEFKVMSLAAPDDIVISSKEFKPHVVILDLGTPDANSVTLIQLLKVSLEEEADTKSSKLMILFDKGWDNILGDITALNIPHIIEKPISTEDILNRIENIMEEKMKSQSTVLCIDDEENILKSLTRLLEETYTVITAKSAEEGVKLYKENLDKISVIIVDFRMPGKTGIECIHEIKNINPDAVCLVLSGINDFGEHLKTKDNDFVYSFLDKPWDDDVLLEKVDEAINVAEKNK
ncbi:MAG: HDOD domain-containing protein [Candidatus Aureabacteria bacterium]|nr:HDOD domain-containing protein [Candidatus Auribacterota bacterium]